MPGKSPNIEKIFFPIGEVAEIIGVTPSSIRYWENNFDELKPRKSSRGTRHFSQNDIELLKLICHLVKERGLTIKGARKKLKDNREETINNWEMVRSLQRVKEELTAIRDQLDELYATNT